MIKLLVVRPAKQLVSHTSGFCQLWRVGISQQESKERKKKGLRFSGSFSY